MWFKNHDGLVPELSCHTRTVLTGPMQSGIERIKEIILPLAKEMQESCFKWNGRLAPNSPSSTIKTLAVVPELRQMPVDT